MKKTGKEGIQKGIISGTLAVVLVLYNGSVGKTKI